MDLCVVSVLLDAGAGPAWRYHEAGTGQTLTRSEGLGVASLHAFASGLFSGDGSPRADAAGLDGQAMVDEYKALVVEYTRERDEKGYPWAPKG